MSSYPQMSESHPCVLWVAGLALVAACQAPRYPPLHTHSLVWGSENVGVLGKFSRGLAPLGSPHYE